MIINKELGIKFNENPWQGSFVVDYLTDMVEEGTHADEVTTEIELIRLTSEEKGQQIENVRNCQENRNKLAPRGETSHSHKVGPDGAGEEAHDGQGLGYLQRTARERRNVFEALIETGKTHSFRQISKALYDAGREYRRNM